MVAARIETGVAPALPHASLIYKRLVKELGASCFRRELVHCCTKAAPSVQCIDTFAAISSSHNVRSTHSRPRYRQ